MQDFSSNIAGFGKKDALPCGRTSCRLLIKMCRKTPSLQGWGYKARPPNLRKELKADKFLTIVLIKYMLYNITMKRIYHSNHNIVYSCKYHVVFCPKYRRKVLVNGVDTRLKELVEHIAEEYSFEVIEMEIMPDHVHLLLEVDPQFGIHKAVKTIKGKTSQILRQEFHWLTTKLPCLWTNSYFCSTVGGAPLEIVRQYIESQKTSQRK